jgi:hypothetical protein
MFKDVRLNYSSHAYIVLVYGIFSAPLPKEKFLELKKSQPLPVPGCPFYAIPFVLTFSLKDQGSILISMRL